MIKLASCYINISSYDSLGLMSHSYCTLMSAFNGVSLSAFWPGFAEAKIRWIRE